MHVQDEKAFFQIVTAAFALRRKTMTNSLCASLHLDRGEAATLINAAGLNGTMRGEDLTMEQLGNLADIWAERKNGQ